MSLVVALLIFILVSTTLALILCNIYGALSVSICLFSFFIAMVSSLLYTFKLKVDIPVEAKAGFAEKIVIYVFILFCMRQFFWIYFYKGGHYISLNSNNIGDLPLHLTLINHIVQEGHFWPQNPLYASDKLTYPFGVDLFTAMWIKLGVSTEQALVWIGFICSMMTLVLLYRWARGFGVAAFLFSGGLAGPATMYNWFPEVVADMFAWKNAAITLLVPQRGFLIGFPVGLFLLWSWRQRFFRDKPVFPQLLEGLMWGLLPFFHIHTFLFVSFVFIFWSLAQNKFKQSLPIFIFALIPAIWEVLILTDNLSRVTSVIWIKPGWLLKDHNPILFYALNFGFFIPLVALGAMKLKDTTDRESKVLLVTGLYLFFVLMFVMFAPWEWDNTKLIIWAYLVSLPALYNLVLKNLNPLRRSLWVMSLFIAGALLIFNSAKAPGIRINGEEELISVCNSIKTLPVDEKFIVLQTFNHPVALCGRLLVAGHSAHIWTHGYRNQSTIERLIKSIYKGDDDWRRAAKILKVRYLFWGIREQKAFPKSGRPWEQTQKRVALSVWGSVYDLTQPSNSPKMKGFYLTPSKLDTDSLERLVNGSKVTGTKKIDVDQ